MASTTTPRCASRPTGSWSPRGRRFPPRALVPPCRSRNLRFPTVTDPEAPPLRPERHIPNSIATMRRRLIVAIARSLSRCPCCTRHTFPLLFFLLFSLPLFFPLVLLLPPSPFLLLLLLLPTPFLSFLPILLSVFVFLLSLLFLLFYPCLPFPSTSRSHDRTQSHPSPHRRPHWSARFAPGVSLTTMPSVNAWKK